MTTRVVGGNRARSDVGVTNATLAILKASFDLWGLLDFGLGLRIHGSGFRV
jgi:hypothetical protein